MESSAIRTRLRAGSEGGELGISGAICRHPVGSGDHVIFDHGDLIHLACHLGVRDLAVVLEDFLRVRRGRPYCYACLCAELELTSAEARKAVARLPLAGEFRSDTAEPCVRCHMRKLSVRAQ